MGQLKVMERSLHTRLLFTQRTVASSSKTGPALWWGRSFGKIAPARSSFSSLQDIVAADGQRLLLGLLHAPHELLLTRCIDPEPKTRRGFANMDPARVRAIASMGEEAFQKKKGRFR